jgi:hypothetical protein
MTDNATVYKKQKLIKNKQPKTCECGCNMDYSEIDGLYTCSNCGYSELDLYGKMKELLTVYPNLTKIELSAILQEPIKNLNQYIEDGRLVNKDIY